MKCAKCTRQAEVKIPFQRVAFCREHFIEYFHSRIRKAIGRYRMFSKKDKLLVAVSGGKDSMGLALALKDLGYDVLLYHINIGIGEFSDMVQRKVEVFAKDFDFELEVESVAQNFSGLGLPQLALLTSRKPCSLCGMIKRYLMNRAALRHGAVLVTAHNLNDEAVNLLRNVMGWDFEQLSRQEPVLPAREGLARKAKPYIFISEYESAAYSYIRGIDYVMEACPQSGGATSHFLKRIVGELERRFPGFRINFVRKFYDNKKSYFPYPEKPVLNRCKICGQPTTGEICSFCRLKLKVEESLSSKS